MYTLQREGFITLSGFCVLLSFVFYMKGKGGGTDICSLNWIVQLQRIKGAFRKWAAVAEPEAMVLDTAIYPLSDSEQLLRTAGEAFRVENNSTCQE